MDAKAQALHEIVRLAERLRQYPTAHYKTIAQAAVQIQAIAARGLSAV